MRNIERQIALFGKAGQQRINETAVTVVGVGGLGTHVVQQLAFLGVKNFTLIDPEELDNNNLNRYVGARIDDPIPGTLKVDIAERLICSIERQPKIQKLPVKLQTRDALEAITAADMVFGCVDKESLRFILNHFCVAFAKRLLDCGTGVDGEGASLRYGGQVFVMWGDRVYLMRGWSLANELAAGGKPWTVDDLIAHKAELFAPAEGGSAIPSMAFSM